MGGLQARRQGRVTQHKSGSPSVSQKKRDVRPPYARRLHRYERRSKYARPLIQPSPHARCRRGIVEYGDPHLTALNKASCFTCCSVPSRVPSREASDLRSVAESKRALDLLPYPTTKRTHIAYSQQSSPENGPTANPRFCHFNDPRRCVSSGWLLVASRDYMSTGRIGCPLGTGSGEWVPLTSQRWGHSKF